MLEIWQISMLMVPTNPLHTAQELGGSIAVFKPLVVAGQFPSGLVVSLASKFLSTLLN